MFKKMIIIMTLIMCIIMNMGIIVAYADVEFNNKVWTDEDYIKAVNDVLIDWIEEDEWDFLGKKGSGELVHMLRVAYVGEEHYTEDGLVKFSGIKRGLEFDIGTVKSQLRLMEKQIDNNDFIYGGLAILIGGSIWGTKVYLGMSNTKKLTLIKALLNGKVNKGFEILVKNGMK